MVSLTEVEGSDYNGIKGSNDQEELDYDENLPEDLDRVQIKPPDPEPLVVNGISSTTSKAASELGEVNTDEDEGAVEDQPNGLTSKKSKNEDAEDLEDGECPDSDEEGSDSKSNGEICDGDSTTAQGKSRNIAKLYQKYLDEGDVSEGEETGLLEEGEDDSEFYGRSKVPCKYFLRGHCLHGQMCRYLHEKSGNFSGDQYEFVPHQPNREILELRSPIKDRRPPPPPPQYLSDFEEEMPEAEPQSLISKAWTSGLKDAREMIKRSKQKKETDIDFEQRKMLAGIESLDDSADYNLHNSQPSLDDPPPLKKYDRSRSPSPNAAKDTKGTKSSATSALNKVAVPSSFGADQWQDPWQRSSATDHSHHISGAKSRRHNQPGGKERPQDARGMGKNRKRSGSSSSDSSRSRQGKRSRSSSSSSRSHSRSSRSRSRSRSPAKWKKGGGQHDLMKKGQLPSSKSPLDESFKPTVNEKKINVYDTKKKPLNGGSAKSAEDGTATNTSNKPSSTPAAVSTISASSSGNQSSTSKQPVMPSSDPHSSSLSSPVPTKIIAPPELRLQQKASKSADKQAKKQKRRSESSSSSGSSSNSSSSSDSDSSSSDSANEGGRPKKKKNAKRSEPDEKGRSKKKNMTASHNTLKDSDAAKIIKSIADSEADTKHWKDVKKEETSVLSTPLLLPEGRNSYTRKSSSSSPTKGKSEKSRSRHERDEGTNKSRRKRSGSRSLSMSSISSASSEETSRGNHRKREKKKLKNSSTDKLAASGSKEAKKSKNAFATPAAGAESVSGKKGTSGSSLTGHTHSSSKSKSSSKHGSSSGKSQSKTNRKQQLMAQLAEIEEKIARTRQKCSKEVK